MFPRLGSASLLRSIDAYYAHPTRVPRLVLSLPTYVVRFVSLLVDVFVAGDDRFLSRANYSDWLS